MSALPTPSSDFCSDAERRYSGVMGKGASYRANLQATRAQMNNAKSSAQARAFKARQLAKQKREAEERKLRAAQATTERAGDPAAAQADGEEPSE